MPQQTIVERIKNGYVPPKSHSSEYNTYLYLQEEDISVDAEGSDVINFLKNKVILLTGGIGFLGKLTVDKLLRSCKDIDTIYLIVRDKKGVAFEERIDKIFNDHVFSKLKEIYPDFKDKIVGINGNVEVPNLGLSKSDRRLLTERVEIIYHGAATTRFNEALRKAVNVNVRGTQEMLKFAKDCKELKSFVHISTAYSNCNHKVVGESFYDPLMTAEKIYSIVEAYSDEKLEEITPTLIGKLPNTYTFTKQIGEDLVKKLGVGMPVCVYRPSIVTCTYKEPIKGWIDNFYGPMGSIAGGGLGLLHTGYVREECKADLVPADYAVNACIAASYRTAVERRMDDIPIYNFVSGERNPLTWGKYSEYIQTEGPTVATSKAVWYPSCVGTRHRAVYHVLFFCLHIVPAFLADTVLRILGKQPMLMKAYEKIYRYFEAIRFFATNQWQIEDDRTRHLYNSLSEKDRKNFFFGIENVDWRLYFIYACFGTREFLLKDDLSTLEEGWRRRNKFQILHVTLKWLFFSLLLRYLYLFGKLFYRML